MNQKNCARQIIDINKFGQTETQTCIIHASSLEICVALNFRAIQMQKLIVWYVHSSMAPVRIIANLIAYILLRHWQQRSNSIRSVVNCSAVRTKVFVRFSWTKISELTTAEFVHFIISSYFIFGFFFVLDFSFQTFLFQFIFSICNADNRFMRV